MTEGRGNPGGPAKDQINWHVACELLKAGQYERVAELLHEAQVASERTGDTIPAHILDAARRICLACSQCRADIEWHRQAYEEADQREDELRQQLHTILDLISGREASVTGEKREGPPSAPTVEMSLPERGAPQALERRGLWQRIQSLLGRRPSPRSLEREAPVVSAEAPPPPSAEKAEVPTAPPIVKKEERRLPSLAVYCLGPFRVYQNDQLITDWDSLKGQCILKYLVAHRGRPIAKDILMALVLL